MNHEQATAECQAIITGHGQRFARTIMATTMMHELEPDQMETLVHTVVNGFREILEEGGIQTHDVEAAAQSLYAAIVKEGARLSRTVVWEGGRA